MNKPLFSVILFFVLLQIQPLLAQTSLPPASKEELEALYTTGIENRTEAILDKLKLVDTATSNQVHDIIIAEYRALRARDEAIDAKLRQQGMSIDYSNRAPELVTASKPLHDKFISQLSSALTPGQVDQVKDLMTYNKVTFTYNAYCNIVPDLSDADKAKVMEFLKQAREEAIDGGSAPEKSIIFQKYKDEINQYLDAHGHNVEKSMEQWQASHTTASITPAVR